VTTKKKPRTILVEECPCEVLEESVETGVVHQDESLRPNLRPLVVAPNGELLLVIGSGVSICTPSYTRLSGDLRRMARELSK
jgi:hypothetical protein